MTKDEGAAVCCAAAAISVEDAQRPTVVSERPGKANLTVLVFHTTGILVRLNRLPCADYMIATRHE